ncbi:OmpA family protein [Chitinispirillales bacterium ANBcel5]|uniref:OmpA family protein n=1 Tax=Cellulosispirillum alkaliphilum TaxID=3039283 RepID=UPI002A4F85F3|nr:OmpA family protein [Chitinispirillales bacterium ANBcel5]
MNHSDLDWSVAPKPLKRETGKVQPEEADDDKPKFVTGVDESERDLYEDAEPEVRLISAQWKPGPKGFYYNEQCFLEVKAEYLKETIRAKIRGKLFCTFDGKEEDLAQVVEGFIEKDGTAVIEIEHLWYMNLAHYNACKEDPNTPCSYTVKNITHSRGENTIDSPELEMPWEPVREVHKIEIEDLLFNINSAVMLPDTPISPVASHRKSENGLKASDVQANPTGLCAMRAVFKYINQNSDKSLVIVGHTDSSGGVKYNFELSEKRANNILCLLTGDCVGWAEICTAQHRVEDYQQILKHFSGLLLWPCDPGPVDNVLGPKTKEAVQSFQTIYNENRESMGFVGEAIPVTEPTGNNLNIETWKAFFNLYIWELSIIVAGSENPGDLKPFKDMITFVDPQNKTVGCGESFPIEAKDKPNFKSKRNRRVELLFFDSTDTPAIEVPPYSEETFTKEQFPLYDSNKYISIFHEAHLPRFMPFMEIQTVDSFGFPVPDFDLTIESDNDDIEQQYRVTVKTNDNGFVRVHAVPIGLVYIRNSEGDFLTKHSSDGQITEAIFEPRAAQKGIISVIAKQLPPEQVQLRDQQIKVYNKTNAIDCSILSMSPRENQICEFFGIKAENFIPTTDNLLLSAGFDNQGRPNISKFASDVLKKWLLDYYPAYAHRDYNLFYINYRNNRWMFDVYNSEGKFLGSGESFYELRTLIGTFTLIEQHENKWFRDITNKHYTIRSSLDRGVPLSSAAPWSRNLLLEINNKMPICYYLPDPIYFNTISLMGGTGHLEPYRKDFDNGRVHERNLNVVRCHDFIYKHYIHNYIERVKTFANDTELRALGPPIRGYQFPIPVNATRQQFFDLVNVNNTAQEEQKAWLAITSKINEIIGRRSSGFYIKLGFDYRGKLNELSNVKLSYNFTLDSDGKTFHKLDTAVTTEANKTFDISKIGSETKRSFESGLEHEYCFLTEDHTLTAKIKIGAYEFATSSDGKFKVSQNITNEVKVFAETNTRDNTMGAGVSVDTPDLPGVPDISIFAGVFVQGLREDTVMAVVSNAPGFFELRSFGELLSPATKWNDLNLREQRLLTVLGFTKDGDPVWENRIFWDYKHLYPIEQFPRSAQSSYYDLSAEEQVAVVHLGFNDATWPSLIKDTAAKQS